MSSEQLRQPRALPTPSPAPATASTRTRSTPARTPAASASRSATAPSARTKSGDGAAAQGRCEQMPGVQYQFSRPRLFALSTPLEVVISGYDLDRLGAGRRTRAHARCCRTTAVPRRALDGRGRQSRDPDRVRPGARDAARPRRARHRRPRRARACAAKSRRATSSRQEDRRARAQRRLARGVDRGSPPPHRQSRQRIARCR